MGICYTAIYLVRNVIFFCSVLLYKSVIVCQPRIPSFYTKKSFCSVNLNVFVTGTVLLKETGLSHRRYSE